MVVHTLMSFVKFQIACVAPKNGCGLSYMLLYDNFPTKACPKGHFCLEFLD